MITTTNLCLKKRIPEISNVDLSIQPGECYVLLSSGDNAVEHLINIFLGLEKDFQGSVKVDDIDIRDIPGICLEHIIFLSKGREWPPEMNIGSLLDFFKNSFEISEEMFEELYIKSNMESLIHKKISALTDLEWRKFLFSVVRLKKGKNFIFRDFVKGMPLDFTLEFKKSLREMKKELCSILYMGDDVFFALEIGDRIGFIKKGKLLLELPVSKLKKMDLKELYFQFLVEG